MTNKNPYIEALGIIEKADLDPDVKRHASRHVRLISYLYNWTATIDEISAIEGKDVLVLETAEFEAIVRKYSIINK